MQKILGIIAIIFVVLIIKNEQRKITSKKTYDSPVTQNIEKVANKAISDIKASGIIEKLQEELYEAKKEWEETGKADAKEKYEKIKEALIKAYSKNE